MLKSQQMKAELKGLKTEAKNLLSKDGVTAEEINNKASEIETLEAKIKIQEKIENDEKLEIENSMKNGGANPLDKEIKNKPTDIGNLIAKAAVGTLTAEEKTEFKNLIQESVDENGGIIVPDDLKTKIKPLQRNKFDIRKYLNIEKTGTLKGSRPKQKNRPQKAGFPCVEEGAAIQKLYEPTFEPVDYKVRKHAGYIPVTNELLEDTPEAILDFILKWLAENELNTYAYQVFNGNGGTTASEGILTDALKVDGKLKDRIEKLAVVPTIKKFKTVFNVDLEGIIGDNHIVMTNAVGYNYLDGLEDKKSNPYLVKDKTKGTGYSFLEKEAVKVPSELLEDIVIDEAGTNVTYTPFLIGDLKQVYDFYDRQQLVIESSKIGGDAWRTDTTEIKGGFRFDGKINGDVKAIKILLVQTDKLIAAQTA